jgi:hypothetical protein
MNAPYMVEPFYYDMRYANHNYDSNNSISNNVNINNNNNVTTQQHNANYPELENLNRNSQQVLFFNLKDFFF